MCITDIRTEIEKVKVIIQSNRAQGAFTEAYLIGQESVLEHFEKLANSMQEGPVSEGLDDYAKGRESMKQQMMNEAVDGYVDQIEFPGKTWIELSDNPKGLKDGDTVKLIIVKED